MLGKGKKKPPAMGKPIKDENGRQKRDRGGHTDTCATKRGGATCTCF
jgi:hypothetical protein